MGMSKMISSLSRRRIALALAASWLVAAMPAGAVAAEQTPPAAEQQAPAAEQKTPAAEQKAPAAAAPQAEAPPTPPPVPAGAVIDPQYVIGPGDTVQVFVWRNPELSVTVPVRPDGKISTPLVEDIVAVGRTSSQLAREMEKVLA